MKKVIHEHNYFDSNVAILEDNTVIYSIGSGGFSDKNESIDKIIEHIRDNYKHNLDETDRRLTILLEEKRKAREKLDQLQEIKENLYK